MTFTVSYRQEQVTRQTLPEALRWVGLDEKIITKISASQEAIVHDGGLYLGNNEFVYITKVQSCNTSA